MQSSTERHHPHCCSRPLRLSPAYSPHRCPYRLRNPHSASFSARSRPSRTSYPRYSSASSEKRQPASHSLRSKPLLSPARHSRLQYHCLRRPACCWSGKPLHARFSAPPHTPSPFHSYPACHSERHPAMPASPARPACGRRAAGGRGVKKHLPVIFERTWPQLFTRAGNLGYLTYSGVCKRV